MRIRICHIIYQLSTGGLENGLVNLINQLDPAQYEHVIISLTSASDFKNRIKQNNCQVICIHKAPGSLVRYYGQLYRLLKQLSPDIVHTRNLAAIECQSLAWLARVPYRIHGEHGRDVGDIQGTNRKKILLRKLMKPFIHTFVPLSKEIETYLKMKVGVKQQKLHQIYNGVDLSRFSQVVLKKAVTTQPVVISCVGRLQAVKNFPLLIKAFASLQEMTQTDLILWIIGDGPLRASLEQQVSALKISDRVVFYGDRHDVPTLLSKSDIFVLSSQIEGISNTILEAMSCGLPIVASKVGGNPELVIDQQTGLLFESNNEAQLCQQLLIYINNATLRQQHGQAGRQRIQQAFSLDKMVGAYDQLYQKPDQSYK